MIESTRAFLACCCLAGALVSVQVACGGGSSPSSPSPAPTPQPSPSPSPAPSQLWTVSGRVVAFGDGRPVGSAHITSEVGPATDADAAGSFTLGSNQNPPTNPHAFTIDAAGYVSRTAQVRRQSGVRDGIVFDLIPLAAPFSLDFYRALVRNGHEAPAALEPLRRWISNPRFYVRSVDQDGRPIEPEVMAIVLSTIPDAVRQFTGGRITAQVESGTEAKVPTTEWINVDILRDPTSTSCGTAKIGANPGQITLFNDLCGCGSQKIRGRTVAHEVGHALGFWHVPGPDGVMTSSAPGCPPAILSDAERFHGAIAYQRPPGNRDPDADPSNTFAAQLRGGTDDAPTVSCPLR